MLVSLLTLILPWSGCQFIRETESALREGQQNMLGGAAQAIADSLSQFPADFLAAGTDGIYRDSQVYIHPLEVEPLVDGYRDDWTLDPESVRTLRGVNGDIEFVIGGFRQHVFVVVDVRDANLVYADPGGAGNADRVEVHSVGADGQREEFVFQTGAPGALIGRRRVDGSLVEDSRISAHWQNTASGYRVEARLPRQLLGDYLGLLVVNTDSASSRGIRSATFDGPAPGRMISPSPVLSSVVRGYAQDDLRLIVTDRAGWRLASEGTIGGVRTAGDSGDSGWMRIAYNALLEPGAGSTFADPNPLGRERENYVVSAMNGTAEGAWFRSEGTGRAVVAVAQPVWSGSVQTGLSSCSRGPMQS